MILQSDEPSKAVPYVGRVCRIIHFFGLCVALSVALFAYDSRPNLFAAAAITLPAMVSFALSLRVRLRVAGVKVLFQAHFRKYEFDLSLGDEFQCVLYEGFWNRYSAVDRFLNANAYMLEVSVQGGREISLPATIGGRERLTLIAEHLNDRSMR